MRLISRLIGLPNRREETNCTSAQCLHSGSACRISHCGQRLPRVGWDVVLAFNRGQRTGKINDGFHCLFLRCVCVCVCVCVSIRVCIRVCTHKHTCHDACVEDILWRWSSPSTVLKTGPSSVVCGCVQYTDITEDYRHLRAAEPDFIWVLEIAAQVSRLSKAASPSLAEPSPQPH